MNTSLHADHVVIVANSRVRTFVLKTLYVEKLEPVKIVEAWKYSSKGGAKLRRLTFIFDHQFGRSSQESWSQTRSRHCRVMGLKPNATKDPMCRGAVLSLVGCRK
ncbi:hypothetical protein TNCV_2724021 [Trichonephila clavipes]|nr:hypothetical protein TNCV_2724021 [Trichonephila clavipes]